MARQFKESLDRLPPVDLPDWELLARLDELFARYRLEINRLRFTASDRRGRYQENDLQAFRRETEAQEDPPHSVNVNQISFEHRGDTTHTFWVFMREDYSSVEAESTDEAVVAHVIARSRDLLERAAKRREDRLAVKATSPSPTAPAQPAPATISTRPEADFPSAGGGWRSHGLAIVVGVAATVVGGLILAAILGLS